MITCRHAGRIKCILAYPFLLASLLGWLLAGSPKTRSIFFTNFLPPSSVFFHLGWRVRQLSEPTGLGYRMKLQSNINLQCSAGRDTVLGVRLQNFLRYFLRHLFLFSTWGVTCVGPKNKKQFS